MGIDIGKSVFHVVGLDAKGKPVFRNRFTRERLLEFLARASPTIIGMEACPGSNWLARKAIGQGHQVRIVPAQFVKPFVKSNKTDIVDAEAIAEAISRPTMRFTQPKTEAQLDLQALHRIRQRLVSSKTAIVNQARAFLLDILADDGNGLTPAMRDLLQEQWQEYRSIEARLLQLRRQIEAIAGADDVATRLISVPGIAHLTATAITAFAGTAKGFDDEGEVDKGNEHQIEFVEAREDATKALQSTEQPLDFVATFVHFPVVLPRLDARAQRRNDRDEAEIERELSGFVAFCEQALGDPWVKDFFQHEFRAGARIYPGHKGSPIDEPAKALKAGSHGVPGGENMLVDCTGVPRYFTVREAARLQGLPDTFMPDGSWSQAMRQLGNAVPTQLAEVAGRWIRECATSQ
ncbi:hypothetical protein NLI96_g13118 [Meripilus lineatus]|uniref:Transposase IS110-like N-terminal domain-containing protein n=1 Tax=Meripilus lineatus TaxID=2056292 RepID=A0AAD5UNX4_9APHY|nr:hypothetical protein NLI96_g13118 [Physisporinus lineatus]